MEMKPTKLPGGFWLKVPSTELTGKEKKVTDAGEKKSKGQRTLGSWRSNEPAKWKLYHKEG